MSLIKFVFSVFLVSSCLLGAEPWMHAQIERDLAPFREGYCRQCLLEVFQSYQSHLCLVISSPDQGVCFIRGNDLPAHHERFLVMETHFKKLLEEFNYPSTTLLISLEDSWNDKIASPVWAMCKLKQDNKILFPDFEALRGSYNVIAGIHLETTPFPIPWQERHDRMIWRGAGDPSDTINSQNMHEHSRVILCQLSQAYPDLIDAGFTFCYPECLEPFAKERMPIEEIFSHKYQMWVDGCAASYGCSGWRLYTGSTVFKEDSDYVQWYFQDLKPWVHYIPVDKGLGNLVARLLSMQENAVFAQQVGLNGRAFAQAHIAPEPIQEYLAELLDAYLKCPVVAHCRKCQQKSNQPKR